MAEGSPARENPYVVCVTSDMTPWHPSASSSRQKPLSQLTCRAAGNPQLSQVSWLQRHLLTLNPASSTVWTSSTPTMDSLAILICEGGKKEKGKKPKGNKDALRLFLVLYSPSALTLKIDKMEWGKKKDTAGLRKRCSFSKILESQKQLFPF